MRVVSRATWTSVEPVSSLLTWYSWIIGSFSVVLSPNCLFVSLSFVLAAL
jgi:hypothetical protein